MVTAPPSGASFDEVVLPHLEAAYRLARWLMRNEHDAEDVVQEASLRAFQYFRTYGGGDARAWFLSIVRNTCRTWQSRRVHATNEPFDEDVHSGDRPASDPEALVLQTDDVLLIEQAMSNVPERFRELLVRRELEGLSYRELAHVMGIPIGTVMSGLSRGRDAFRRAVENQMKERGHNARRRGSPAVEAGTQVRSANRPAAARRSLGDGLPLGRYPAESCTDPQQAAGKGAVVYRAALPSTNPAQKNG